MPRGMTSETRGRVVQEQAEETARRWSERISLGGWTCWHADPLNWVLQPDDGKRDNYDRSFYPTFLSAMLALADRVTGALPKRTAREFAAACESVRVEVRRALEGRTE